ncbi:MAG: magnesium transporter CorA [Clostridia bacterium]|nr:magnesium transporter CorA [Clostridia bacterium]NCC42952.1 magnesium transporter CorA [Clostridia bacterium]
MNILDSDYQKKEGDILISVVTTEECEQLYHNLPFYSVMERNMRNHNIRYCKAEMLKNCIIGTLLIPDKQFPKKAALSVTFYLKDDLLILVDDSSHLDTFTQVIKEGELTNAENIAEFFWRLLGHLIQDDSLFLQNMEQDMAELEEKIPHTDQRQINALIGGVRKNLLVLNSYYQQLQDFCVTLEENSNHFFTQEDCQYFSAYSSRIERLYNHAQMLRDYALQIREMHQAQIDMRQNHTMQILTVVTTIFFPLSLITGWYGMNFSNMPELQNSNAYFILIGICAVIVLVEIWLFRKNKWFS